MPCGHRARQISDRLLTREVLRDMAQSTLRIKLGSVKTRDARGFLTAMLQGMQTQCGNGGRVGCVDSSEDAALLAQLVAVFVTIGVSKVHGANVLHVRRGSVVQWLCCASITTRKP